MLINLFNPSALITCSLIAALSCPSTYFFVLSPFAVELGSGPFSLVSAVSNDTVFGVNRTSSTVFPLLRERPERMPSRGIMFNFMVTAGMQRDRTSRECLFFKHLCPTKVSPAQVKGGGFHLFSCAFTGIPVVSLESAERPNYFLVVSEHGRLHMERWGRGAEFSRRATFIQHQGLFLPGHTSFELVGQPGIFLTLTRTAAQARRYDPSDGFKISSSFTLEGWQTRA